MQCFICYENNDENSKKLKCSHKFHSLCLVKWIEAKLGNGPVNCPCCRQEFNESIIEDEFIKFLKTVHKMPIANFIEFISSEKVFVKFEEIKDNERRLEETKIYAPLFYKFLTLSKEEFSQITNLLVDIEEQTEKRKIEKKIRQQRKKEEDLRLAEIARKMIEEEMEKNHERNNDYIINPTTGRRVRIGGKTYRLLKRGEQI